MIRPTLRTWHLADPDIMNIRQREQRHLIPSQTFPVWVVTMSFNG